MSRQRYAQDRVTASHTSVSKKSREKKKIKKKEIKKTKIKKKEKAKVRGIKFALRSNIIDNIGRERKRLRRTGCAVRICDENVRLSRKQKYLWKYNGGTKCGIYWKAGGRPTGSCVGIMFLDAMEGPILAIFGGFQRSLHQIALGSKLINLGVTATLQIWSNGER